VSEHLFPREYDWRVWLVDNPSSANASCSPGGKIIVYTGILDLIDFAVDKGICRSKHDALAVVMAHEIGHALARHTAESVSMLPLVGLQWVLGMESPLLQYIFQFGEAARVVCSASHPVVVEPG
jgi:Zn-dependent protease with chaperone function